MMWLVGWFGAAFAGQLSVQVAPVQVSIDGRPAPTDPATGGVLVGGLVGTHVVEVWSASGELLARQSVVLGRRDGVVLVFDGSRLSTGAGVVGPQWPVRGAPSEPPLGAFPMQEREMAPERFASLLKQIAGQAYSDGKVKLVQVAAQDSWFTIQQVGQLVDAMSYAADQVQVVQIVQPHVLDPENAFELASHFSFDADAQRVLSMFQ